MVFVLGIERSATTWISNILDMHPGTELFMEPLSANISGFKDWPNRFKKIQDLSDKAHYFREEFEQLKKRKRFLLTRISDTNLAWNTDMMAARKWWNISPKARDFFELNFHRIKGREYPSKSAKPIPVIKELRLNYNAELIPKISPAAKVIVILRNYAGNIRSIEHQFKQENLQELAELLRAKYGNTNVTTIFDYWATSYNTLLGVLERTGTRFMILQQEELIRSGKKSANELLSFIGLEHASAVYDYLAASNKKGTGKHSTDRDHDAILEKNRRAESELQPLLRKQIDRISWHALLKERIIKTEG